MRIAEIEALKLSDVIAQAIEKHFGEARSHALKAENNDVNLSDDENFYNRIMFDLAEGETEPTLADMIRGKELAISELIQARVQELMTSVDAKYFQKWGYEQGLVYNQIIPFLESKAREDDELFFTDLAAQFSLYAIEDNKSALVLHGEAVKMVCEKTLNYITGMNSTKGLTGEQIDTLQQSYSGVEDALRKQRPAKALGLLASVTPIADIVSQDEIDAVVAVLTSELQKLAAE